MSKNPVAKVRLFLQHEGWKLDGPGVFARWLEGELLREGRAGLIHLVFVDDDEIAEMNEQYLEHEGATDVISFDLTEKDDGDFGEFANPTFETLEEGFGYEAFPTGEVYVSLNRALEQAREYGVTVTDEASRLALHGMLHLAGWEDEQTEQRKKMSVREDEGLSRAKVEGDFPWLLHEPHDGRQ